MPELAANAMEIRMALAATKDAVASALATTSNRFGNHQ
jgi:hypothetical protein